MPFDVGALPIVGNLAVFVAAAAVVWAAGTKLSDYADVLAERTGLGRAFVGLVLLGATTSLPEIATTATAALAGSPALVMNNLFGSVVTNTAVLAMADFALARYPLSFVTPKPVLLLQGTSVIVLVALGMAGMAAAGTLAVWGVGAVSVLLFVGYLLSLYVFRRYEGSGRWTPVDPPPPAPEDGDRQERPYRDVSTGQLALRFAAAAAVILVAGWAMTIVGDALARQTGLGGGFVGFALLATATSLPELSTTIRAVRLGAYSMAFTNIFGSSAFVLALVLLADVLYREGPILAAVDRSAMFAAAAGIVVTAVYVMGLIERRDRQVLRLGLDSAAVLVLYVVTLGMTFTLRGG